MQALKANTAIWYKLHVLLYDLRSFRTDSVSRERLEAVNDISYIGEPYFSSEEATTIKNTQTKTEGVDEKGRTLSQAIEEEVQARLDRRMGKRVETGDFRVCAAHDLAPVLARLLGVDMKMIEKDKGFLDLVRTKGIYVGDEQWEGLMRKSFAPKGKKSKKKCKV